MKYRTTAHSRNIGHQYIGQGVHKIHVIPKNITRNKLNNKFNNNVKLREDFSEWMVTKLTVIIDKHSNSLMGDRSKCFA